MTVKPWVLIFLIFFMLGCAHTPETALPLRIQAAPSINRDHAGNALPVRVKIYQLNDVTLFNEATFRQLWKSDDAILGKSLLSKKELTINPGEQVKVTMKRQAHAEYLAVVGIFRLPHQSGWKAITPLPNSIASFFQPLRLAIKGNHMELQ